MRFNRFSQPRFVIARFLFFCFTCVAIGLTFARQASADYVVFVNSVNASPSPAIVNNTVNATFDIGFFNDGTVQGYIDFGDGTASEWGFYDVYSSSITLANGDEYNWFSYGGTLSVPHKYTQTGTYTITVFAGTNLFYDSRYPPQNPPNPYNPDLPYYDIKTATVMVVPVHGVKRKLRPGECEACGRSGKFSGNASDTTVDPVPTRGFPLGYNVTVNTQTVETNRPLGNAAFTCDIHVGTQTVYDDNANASTNWVVVDENGRRWDFGNASANPVGEPGVFSTLTVTLQG